MSSGRMKEMRQKEDKELLLDMNALRKELFDLRFQSSTEKLSNPSRISAIKKDVARVLTLLRERGLTRTGDPTAGAAAHADTAGEGE